MSHNRFAQYNLKTFMLGVHGIPEKTQAIMAYLASIGINAEVFNGVNAHLCGLHTIFPYEKDSDSTCKKCGHAQRIPGPHPGCDCVEFEGSGWNIGPIPVAVWMSSYMLWSAMSVLPDEHFLQLEWDTHFVDGWRERAEQAFANVPADFDMLFLGSCCCGGRPTTPVKGEVFDVRYPMCGHAMVIAKKALPIILSSLTKVYSPMDIALADHAMPKLKVYTVLPRIADQIGKDIPE